MIYASSLATAAALLGLASCAIGAEDDQDRPKGGDPAPKAALPLTQVILYASGVGYFQRDGQVDGHAEVELRFKTEDINDLLKSLVVQDLDGGQVSTVTYGSRDPIAKTLKSFGIDLTSNPALGALLGQVRGERVEVATPAAVTGTILGVETKKQPAGDGQGDRGRVPQPPDRRGAALGPAGPGPADQAARTTGSTPSCARRWTSWPPATTPRRRPSRSGFDGQGQRRVRVAYIVATPVWKTSYRLVLDDEGAAVPAGLGDRREHDRRRLERRPAVAGLGPADLVRHGPVPAALRRRGRWSCPSSIASLRPQVYGQAMEERRSPRTPRRCRRAEGDAERPASRRTMPGTPMAGGAPDGRAGDGRARAPGRELDLKQGVAAAAAGAPGRRAVPVRDQVAGHAGAAEVGDAADPQPGGRGAEGLDLQRVGAAEAPAQRLPAQEHHAAAPDAGADHRLRRRRLRRRRPHRGPRARARSG